MISPSSKNSFPRFAVETGIGAVGEPDSPGYLGVDGCRGGWLAVRWVRGRSVELAVLQSLRHLRPWLGDRPTAGLWIDMPIGLPDGSHGWVRGCDGEARRFLGKRGSSIFPAPIRSILAEDDYHSANAKQRRLAGKGLSCQTWNLVPKICELDQWIEQGADSLCPRESHPEVLFKLLGGKDLESKVTDLGVGQRKEVLRRHSGGLLFESRVPGISRSLEVDYLDASVLAIGAALADDGLVGCFGGELDLCRRRMEIVYPLLG